jgi:Zn-dependent protease with chaperone function
MATGLLCETKHLRSHPVQFEFGSGALHITGENIRESYPVESVRVSDRLADVPRFLYLPDGRVLESGANDVIDAELKQQNRGRVAAFVATLERHSAIAAVATLVIAAILVFTVRVGVPALARQVAHAAPKPMEEEIGNLALNTLRTHLLPSTLTRAQRQEVHAALRRVLPDVSEAELPKLTFLSTGGAFANAFALPGNRIVVTDELIALADEPDEITAVLAHEVGHLHHRHGLQMILNQSMSLLLVASITGDLSSLTGFAASLPVLIANNGYSRDFEREADDFARDVLTKQGIPLERFASILRKLDEQFPASPKRAQYLSTHPHTEDRIQKFSTKSEAKPDGD